MPNDNGCRGRDSKPDALSGSGVVSRDERCEAGSGDPQKRGVSDTRVPDFTIAVNRTARLDAFQLGAVLRSIGAFIAGVSQCPYRCRDGRVWLVDGARLVSTTCWWCAPRGAGGGAVSSRLDEIRARLAAAAPGPWSICDDGFDGNVVDANGRDVVGGEPYEGRVEPDDPSVILIAHAPADLAYLLERVERLEHALREAREGFWSLADVVSRHGLPAVCKAHAADVTAALDEPEGM